MLEDQGSNRSLAMMKEAACELRSAKNCRDNENATRLTGLGTYAVKVNEVTTRVSRSQLKLMRYEAHHGFLHFTLSCLRGGGVV